MAPDPVSNILSNWMLERARDRNARADRLIAEIDGYLANPITTNRYMFGGDNALLHMAQRDDGSYVSIWPGFHRSWASTVRDDMVRTGLDMQQISDLRRIALQPAPSRPAARIEPLANANERLGLGITESDEEWLDE